MSDIDDTTQDLAADGGLALPASSVPAADEPDNSVAAGMAALASAFGGSTPAAAAAQTVLRESPAQVLRIAGETTRTRKGRLAFLDCLYDDSSSMEDFWQVLMAGHGMMLDMLRAEIAHDSVETFVAAGGLNAGVFHGYTLLGDAPRLNDRPLRGGGTLWMKRYGQELAALGIKVGQTDEQGRETTGVAFLGTDGWDTEMYQLQEDYPEWKHGNLWRERLAERFENLQQVIKGFVAAGNISAAVAFMGKLVEPGHIDYEFERNAICGARESVGLTNPRGMDLQELIQDMFRVLGFPEDMIFLPGADMRRLAEVLAAVSRSMVQRSRGVKPRGNADIDWTRH